MGRHAAWQNKLADQLFVGDHSVLDCTKVNPPRSPPPPSSHSLSVPTHSLSFPPSSHTHTRKVIWHEGKGTYVANEKRRDDTDDANDADWFDQEESLPMETKTEIVEEMVVKMEEDDEGWNSEDDIQAYTEGDEEILAEGRALLAQDPHSSITRTPRLRFQNPNHSRTI